MIWSWRIKPRGRAQIITAAAMIVAFLTLIIYRISSNETRPHSQTLRTTIRHHIRKSDSKMEDINEFSTMTQSPMHLAKQKAYEARIMADVKNRAEEGRMSRRLLYPSLNSFSENKIGKSMELRSGPAMFTGERIVHLDLKGAPPRMGYIEELFPLLRTLGATGVLIEYEDMFPYSGPQLQDFPAYNAYSKSDIKGILKLAASNGLEVIPLIQTFGHMEFILKLQKYAEMREVHRYPQVICPTHNATFSLLTAMVDQIVAAHPGIKHLHIGCDEVYYLGECVRCGLAMVDNKWSRTELFLYHVTRMAKYVKHRHPGVTPLTWDDEFRRLSETELRSWGVADLLEPVVWKYTADVVADIPPEVWDKYAAVFPAVWLASAFKGATGANKYTTNIGYHLENHRAWMEIVTAYAGRLKFKGLVITGWQRYDHFAVLCELLPVGIPSLAVTLAYIQMGSKGAVGGIAELTSVPQSVLDALKCDAPFALTPGGGRSRCGFPGAAVLDAAERLHSLQLSVERFTADSTVMGWLQPYNVKHGFSSPSHVEHATAEVDRCKMELVYIERDMTTAMADVYDRFTADEWIETYLRPLDVQLQKLWDAKESLLARDHWPKRPLDILAKKEKEF